MNKPGCNKANKLCCWAGVMAKGFMAAKAAKDVEAAAAAAAAAVAEDDDEALLGR